MVISLTESYVLSARVLGNRQQEIARQATSVACLILMVLAHGEVKSFLFVFLL